MKPSDLFCFKDTKNFAVLLAACWFFLSLEQSRTVLLGCRLAASVLREAARGQLFYFILFLLWTIKKKDLIRSGIFPI